MDGIYLILKPINNSTCTLVSDEEGSILARFVFLGIHKDFKYPYLLEFKHTDTIIWACTIEEVLNSLVDQLMLFRINQLI
jgi:hypothetical protein